MKLRTAARALICKEDKILFSKCKDSQGIFYTLPGGGIEANELAHETIKRECLEETGYTVIVNELVLVKEFIKKIPDVAAFKDGLHQIELIFLCSIDYSKEKKAPSTLDAYQIGLEWLEISEIKNQRVFPTENIAKYLDSGHKEARYLSLREGN